MSALAIEVAGLRVEPYAAQPTLVFELAVDEGSGAPVHALALRCQIRLEPQRRGYDEAEREGLVELFGPTSQWGESLRSFLWANTSLVVPSFRGATKVDLPLACSYDLEVAASKYLHALRDGSVPLRLLFSGTAFTGPPGAVQMEPVSWSLEAPCRLPVALWREMMDRYFPGAGWLRLRRETLDALGRAKAERASASWDELLEALLREAGP